MKFNYRINFMNPTIYETTTDGEVVYDIYSRLIKERILFLSEEIDANIATMLTATLFWLDSQDSTQEIEIYINSPGGTVSDGLLTIYDTFQVIKSPIKTICIGEAYSGAAVILAAGTHGKRLAYPNAKIMIHPIQVSEISGSQPEIEKEAKRIRKLNTSVIELIARHTGKSLKRVKKDCQTEKFMNADEALEYGIIDDIVKPNKTIPPLYE